MVRIAPSHTGTIEGDENVERGNWSRQLDFLLSCLGYAVGLGNVWRFPYLSYSNGGGAFFIPYIIMLVFVGMPVFFLELSLGQFTSQGPINAFKFAPIFQGAAVGMVIVSAIVCIYYGVIIALALHYLIASFRAKLPWSSCDNDWNTDKCWLRNEYITLSKCAELNTMVENTGFCVMEDRTRAGIWNYTLANRTGYSLESPASEYYRFRVLRETKGIHNLGPLQWELALTLLATWILVYFSLWKGVKSSGKVVYFTALFPYLVLVILFFRGVTLKGAWKGVKYYVTPEWYRLGEAKVWRDAAGQIFFSLSVCWGGLITLSSYNRFRNNILRDTLIVTIGNCTTSVFAGFVIYSFIGFLSVELDLPLKEVSKDGAGLAFVIYPMAVLELPGSPFWAILFFVMLITLGLDSHFCLLETCTTTVFDMFPHLIAKKSWVILGISIFLFLPGLIYVTHGGNYVLTIVDKYASSWNVLVICLIETLSISYLYKFKRYAKDVKVMLGREPPLFWKICLMGLTQVILLGVLIFDLASSKETKIGTYTFPRWADAIGWVISSLSIIVIPIVAFKNIYQAKGPTVWQKFKTASRPTYDWGPALPKHRMYVDYVSGWQIHPIPDNMREGDYATKELTKTKQPSSPEYAKVARVSKVSNTSKGSKILPVRKPSAEILEEYSGQDTTWSQPPPLLARDNPTSSKRSVLKNKPVGLRQEESVAVIADEHIAQLYRGDRTGVNETVVPPPPSYHTANNSRIPPEPDEEGVSRRSRSQLGSRVSSTKRPNE